VTLLLPDVLSVWNYLLKNPHNQEMGNPQLKQEVIFCATSNATPNVLLTVHHRASVQRNQRDALFIQFINTFHPNGVYILRGLSSH
jgi:hypothetical protein